MRSQLHLVLLSWTCGVIRMSVKSCTSLDSLNSPSHALLLDLPFRRVVEEHKDRVEERHSVNCSFCLSPHKKVGQTSL